MDVLDQAQSEVKRLSVLSTVRELRERSDLLHHMLDLEEKFGEFRVPRRLLQDRLNPLECYNRPNEFKQIFGLSRDHFVIVLDMVKPALIAKLDMFHNY